MRETMVLALLLGALTFTGCGSQKSTDEYIADLKSENEGQSVSAARNISRSKSEADKIVPALIEALNHKGPDVRRSSALKLGEFREAAKEAIPALQKSEKDDVDARVREAAGIALSRIDPAKFPYKFKPGTAAAGKARTKPGRRVVD